MSEDKHLPKLHFTRRDALKLIGTGTAGTLGATYHRKVVHHEINRNGRRPASADQRFRHHPTKGSVKIPICLDGQV